jgi:polysaccharide chain length determinant protein (PEP-CTERM system associated)
MPRESETDEMRAGTGSILDLALGVWSRRKWMGIVVFAVILAAVASVAKFLPDIYRSTATVLVERHNVPEAFVKSSVTGELEMRLQTISQEILSRARLADLIQRLGLYPDLSKGGPIEAGIQKMRRDIQLELKGVQPTSGRGGTVAFNLSYQGRDPETVARVANALASFYVEENVRLREQQAAGTAEFLRLQLAEMKKRLDEQEQRVREFQARHIGQLPQQMAVNLATLERLHTQLDLNSANQLRTMDRRAALAKDLGEPDPAGAAATPDTTTDGLAKLKQELAELRRRFTDKYPDVIRLKAEIAALERDLAEGKPEGRAGTGPATSADPSGRLKATLSKVDAEIKALKAQEQRLRQDIAAYQRRVENAPQREQELRELSRDYETARDLYSSLLKRYEDAQLAESVEQTQRGERFRILDPAIVPKQPAAPNRIQLFLVGLALALGMAVGAIVLAEQFDTSFHTVDDLRTLATAPVLVSIPLIVTEADRRRGRWRFCLAAVAVVLALMVIIKASQYIADGNEQLLRLLARGASEQLVK